MKTYNDEFKIEVNGEKMQACEILEGLTDYDKDCVIELNPGEHTWVMLEGKCVKVYRPYPTIDEEMMAYFGH
jgi:hypothetical protein